MVVDHPGGRPELRLRDRGRSGGHRHPERAGQDQGSDGDRAHDAPDVGSLTRDNQEDPLPVTCGGRGRRTPAVQPRRVRATVSQ